ncbi:MAG: transporter, partial [Chloroflexota bacterium]|nr:transporter [Chloroflexota bacterium]
MDSLKDKACLVGVGNTTYSKNSGMSATKLILTAAKNAIEDAGLKPHDIDGCITPIMGLSSYEIAAELGIPDLKWAVQVNMGGASPVAGVINAAMAVAYGICNYVICPVGWNGYSGMRVKDLMSAEEMTLPMGDTAANFEAPYGAFVPAQWYSVLCRRHMLEFGTTHDHLGAIAVAERTHAQNNPNAQMRGRPMTLEDYHNSRWISDPYHLLDCCIETDGAACCIITSAERAKDMPNKPVYIMGGGIGHPYPGDDISNRPDMGDIGLTWAAPRAFKMAGVKPTDVDFMQIYDCFTFEVLNQIEEVGMCKRGEGGPWLEGGKKITWPDGRYPLNTHGGLLSEGHIIGMNHILEAVRQLRGTANNQVKDAKLGLVTGWGDFGDGSVM